MKQQTIMDAINQSISRVQSFLSDFQHTSSHMSKCVTRRQKRHRLLGLFAIDKLLLLPIPSSDIVKMPNRPIFIHQSLILRSSRAYLLLTFPQSRKKRIHQRMNRLRLRFGVEEFSVHGVNRSRSSSKLNAQNRLLRRHVAAVGELLTLAERLEQLAHIL